MSDRLFTNSTRQETLDKGLKTIDGISEGQIVRYFEIGAIIPENRVRSFITKLGRAEGDTEMIDMFLDQFEPESPAGPSQLRCSAPAATSVPEGLIDVPSSKAPLVLAPRFSLDIMKLKMKKTKDCFVQSQIWREKVNVVKAKQLLCSGFLKDITDRITRQKFSNEHEMIQAYLKGCQTSNSAGIREVFYDFPKSKTGIGRVYPKGLLSLGSMPRAVRHTLCDGQWNDLDIKCCHPTLTVQIWESNGGQAPFLKHYVDNVSSVRKMIGDFWGVSLEQAKQLFNRMCYGGGYPGWFVKVNSQNAEAGLDPVRDDSEGCRKILKEFIYPLQNEINTIAKKVYDSNPGFVKILKADEQRIKDGKTDHDDAQSCLSFLLQSYEIKILDVAVKFCVDRGFIKHNFCIPQQDGLAILREHATPEIPRLLEQVVLEKTGFKVIYEEKAMDQDMSEKIKDVVINLPNNRDYSSMKVQFEEKTCKIVHPPLYVCKDSFGSVHIYREKEMKEAFRNISFAMIDDKGKEAEQSFITKWLSDQETKSYEKMDFLPGDLPCPSNVFNTFQGLEAIKTESSGRDIAIIQRFLMELCDKKDDIYDYFVKWLAQVIQEPHKRTNIAVVIQSNRQGVGKGTLGELMKRILGQMYYLFITNLEELFADHNSALENRLFCVVDEMNAREGFKHSDRIKAEITATSRWINKKNVPQYEIQNFIRYIFFTNNFLTLKIEPTDRRVFMFQAGNGLAGDSEFWRELYTWMDDKHNIRAVYDWLMSIDISGVRWEQDRPSTQFYQENKEVNTPLILRWLCDFHHTKKCEIVNAETGQVLSQDQKLTATEFFQFFVKWRKDNGFDLNYTATKFGIDLAGSGLLSKEQSSDLPIIKGRSLRGVVYTIQMNKLKKALIDLRLISDESSSSDDY